MNIKNNETCLLIIDMQNDFLSEEGYFAQKKNWPVSQFKDLIGRIAKLKEAADQKGWRTIYTQTGYAPDGCDSYTRVHNLIPDIFMEGQTPEEEQKRDHHSVLIKGTWGADIIDELKPGEKDYVISKRRFSAFYQTDLEHMLRSWGIKNVVVTGIVTEVCVESTVREAFIRDFDVIVVEDGVSSWNKKRHDASIENMKFAYAKISDTKKMMDV
jgi:ureidoacrylate peracid hydrolase